MQPDYSVMRIIPPIGLVRCAQIPRRMPVKLTNLTITPKLGILVGVTLLGLCAPASSPAI